ncbi:hypothetical protein IFR05_004334 [Cadophora sp. M221]|nr:hypothetical protein IFR05_004334 [Cadophora sp. M221]
MAEVLGVVASGIAVTQLAGQVRKSIIMLKEYWDQVQEAPAEIKYLLREIDSLNLILSHIQDDQATQTTGGIRVDNLCIRQSLELCKEGADELRGLADELAEKVDGKKGWRKEFEYHQRTRSHRGRVREEVTAKYKLPEFITNKLLELQGHNTFSKWRLTLQTYRVIPDDNPFFSAIWDGDLVSVQQMLANKEYFVSDRDTNWNKTALHVTIAAGIALVWSWEKSSALKVEYWLDANSNAKGEMIDWADNEGRSILHILGRGFAQSSWGPYRGNWDPQIEPDAARAWHPLICRSISAGCSIFSVDNSGKTILSAVIEEYLVYSFYWYRPLWVMKLVLQEWLKDLVECGRDLLAYGDAEKAHWQTGNWGYECSCPQRSTNWNVISCKKDHVSYRHYPKPPYSPSCYPKKGITVSFVHGPRPEDWIFEVYTPAKAYAGEFWRLVESGVVEEPCPIEDTDDGSNSEDGWEWSDDNEEKSVQDPVAQSVPGSWSDFEC